MEEGTGGQIPGGEGGAGAGPGAAEAGAAGGPQPSEEEIRRQIEEEVRHVRVQDVLLQSVVGLINLSARRIAKEDERDLDQARVGIDAVRAVVDLLDPEAAAQVRNALTELQVLYTSAAEGGGAGGEGGEAKKAPGDKAEKAEQPVAGDERKPPDPGSGLWTPPGT